MANDGYASFLEYLTEKHLKLANYKPEDFLYGHNGPCPQLSRDHPFGQAPQILDIPEEEWEDWRRNVRSYYIRERLTLGWDAKKFMRKRLQESGGYGYAEVSDAKFNELMSEGLYSKFLCHALDPQDHATFGNLIEDDVDYWKSDYSCMAVLDEPRDDAYLAPTVVLLKKTPPRKFEVVAIALSYWDGNKFTPLDAPLTPDGSDAWRLAKYFVLQGAIHRINLIDHTKVHFPGDVINAITKSALPTRNLVFQLLLPHFRLTLPVNNAVLEGDKSLINRDSWYAWSPFVAVGLEIRMLLSLAWYGWRYHWLGQNSAYPAYKFEAKPPEIPSHYGDYLLACYVPIRKFVGNVLAGLPAHATDPEWIEIQSWAAQISGWLPGFPEWSDFVFEDAAGRTKAIEKLGNTLATVIHNASVVHSCDHATLHSMINNAPVPFILRVPPPRSPHDAIVVPESLRSTFGELMDFASKAMTNTLAAPVLAAASAPWVNDAAILCYPSDLESICWADLLFYRAHNTTLLIDCDYAFDDQHAKDATVEFQKDLRELSAAQEELVRKYDLPWLDPKDEDDKFRERHCVGAGIQY